MQESTGVTACRPEPPPAGRGTPQRASRRTLLAAAAFASLLAAPAAADRWYEHYARAESALAEGRWRGAVKELNEAIERKGDSGANERTYGMKVVAYFPYLKLGIAYFHLGQYEPALEAFATEERLGAVERSSEDRAALGRYRERALAAKDAAAAARAGDLGAVVARAIADAERLRGEGELELAIETLARALAVAPDSSEASALMSRLQAEASRREREQRDRAQADALVERGRSRLAAGSYAEAASLFSQALEIRPDATTQELLDETQAALRSAAGDRATAVLTAITAARALAAGGRIDEALERLQPALALAPSDRELRELALQVLAAQRARDRAGALGAALTDARSRLAGGDLEGTLAAANRALAAESGNAEALDLVRRAYRAISDRLLGPGVRENLPPAIRFADFREETATGERIQSVATPELTLAGVVIDSTPVTIALSGRDGAPRDVAASSQAIGSVVITEFALHERLPPGASVFRLTATDSDGATSSGEYAVLYERPLHRAPWFLAILVGLPLGAATAVVAARRLRRRRLLRRRFNPYIAGAPVTDERLFVGRERLIARILETVHSNSLLLHGERRIGKTSVQHHLRRRLRDLDDPEYEFHPVYIDLQGTPEERFFATVAEGIFEELEPVLDGLTPASPTAGVYGYHELVGDLRRVLRTLARRSRKRVKLVLLLDEVDELNAYDPRINQKLRSLFMRSFADQMVAVVSGVRIRREWEREGSPWYNFFEEIEVGAVDREAIAALVTEPVKDIFKVGEGVIDRIAAVSEGRPYHAQRLCLALVSRLHERGQREITVADVDAVAERG